MARWRRTILRAFALSRWIACRSRAARDWVRSGGRRRCLGPVTGPRSGHVVAEVDVEDPMEAVLEGPVSSDGGCGAPGGEGRGGDSGCRRGSDHRDGRWCGRRRSRCGVSAAMVGLVAMTSIETSAPASPPLSPRRSSRAGMAASSLALSGTASSSNARRLVVAKARDEVDRRGSRRVGRDGDGRSCRRWRRDRPAVESSRAPNP